MAQGINSTRGPVKTPRGGMGWEVGGRLKKEGTHASLWLIHVDVRQKPTQRCKAIILQFKEMNFKKINKKAHLKTQAHSEPA